jgi:hypothetical protein
MTWVTWRQHRSQAIGALAFVCGLAIVLRVASNPMRDVFGQDHLAGCVAAGTRAGGCLSQIQDFLNQFGFTFNQVLPVLTVIPGLIGVIVGAPLLAREFEHGTWRMAWSQTIPRTRWLAAKLTLVIAGLVVVGAAMTMVFTWYRGPMDSLTGDLIPGAFDFAGVAPTVYLICAFAFAVVAGMLTRRSISAMVIAFIAWTAIRGLDEFSLLAHFQRPVVLRLPLSAKGSFGPNVVPPATGHLGDWVLNITTTAKNQIVTYQPAGRFWTFQFIDAGLYLALAAAALGAAIWLLHRRAA